MDGPKVWGAPAAGLVLVAALAWLAPLAAGEGRTVKVDEKGDKATVELARGDRLLVGLKGNAGTGYSWEVAQNRDAVLRPLGRPTTRREGNLPGGPVVTEFRFEAVAGGSDALVLVYRRPFEKGQPPAREFRLTVRVK